MTIEILSKPSCVQCTATYRAMDSKGISYSVADLTEDATKLALAKELGYLQAPVIVVRDESGSITEHWSGFQPEKVNGLVPAVAA